MGNRVRTRINFEMRVAVEKTETERGDHLSWEVLIADAIERGREDAQAQKQDRSRIRRAQLLAAAVRVFARDGVGRARIADIAAEAGVPLSSVYSYYASKEEIAYAVPVARMTEFFAEFAEKATPMATTFDRLHLFLWLTADFARRNQDWARTLYLEVWPSVMVEKNGVRTTLDDYGRILLSLIAEGARDGEWAEDRQPYQTVTILIGSVSQLIITWLLYRHPRDLMKATGSLIERLLSLLEPQPTHRLAGRKNPSRSAPVKRRPTK